MAEVSEAVVLASALNSLAAPSLRIALLPQSSTGNAVHPLVLERDVGANVDALASIQLLEGHEYLYEWMLVPESTAELRTEPEEIFRPDSNDGIRGRLRPGLSTGVVCVKLLCAEAVIAELEIEVRSRKLHYLTEYRWMLRDIASEMTELVMDRFAASETTFAPAGKGDALTVYQRFAFLKALLTSEKFQSSLNEIFRRPHTSWQEFSEVVRPGQSIAGGSHTLRQLSRPGRRAPWTEGQGGSVRVEIERKRTEATYDAAPNRFVVFALKRWRQVVADLEVQLATFGTTPAIARGRREASEVLNVLDDALSHDLCKEVSELTHFPDSDQVLQRREGYRDIFLAYLEFDLAAALSWRGADSSYSAGQRDVATLYEYWAFVQLAKVVAQLANKGFDLSPLIRCDADGLNVALQVGKETVLSGEVERYGRRLAVDLCFNRTFSSRSGSWTRPMRPDYSLFIKPAIDERATFEPIVVHFDAKYRVQFIDELLGDDAESTSPSNSEAEGLALRQTSALRADLLKMHAYRDAIRRSAGAYVIYPGSGSPSSDSEFREFHELLPGLGAFALRPSDEGTAVGRSSLLQFVGDVLDHVATRLTQHERGRYWLEETFGVYRTSSPRGDAIEPPFDTRMLLGYVKSEEHWDWIHRTKTYNLRTQPRRGGVPSTAALLYCQLLLLYCPDNGRVGLALSTSSPELVEREAMRRTAYPEPAGDYWCLHLAWLAPFGSLSSASAETIASAASRLWSVRGEPVLTTWGDLVSNLPASLS